MKTQEQILKALKREVTAAGGQAAWIRLKATSRPSHSVTAAALSVAMRGDQTIPVSVLTALGVERVTMFRQVAT